MAEIELNGVARFGRPLRVVFVACNRNRHRFMEDPSFLYRCQNPAAALAAQGHDTSLTHLSRLNPWIDADLIVFHRPRHTLSLRAALAVLRRRPVRLVADVDDLIFDESLAQFSPGVRNGLVALADMRQLFYSHHRALSAFDLISVSTAPLQDEVQRCFPAAHVWRLPNAVHQSWLGFPLKSRTAASKSPIITYLPGTRSHDRDFAAVAPVLEQLLAKHPEARLHVTGPLEFEVRARPGQVHHFPKVPFEALHSRVQTGWINLAPLEPTPFTYCKSALKVMEAGYWGIPTVCSPLPDARRFTDAGAIISDAQEAWCEALERLLHSSHCPDDAQALRERVLARADVHTVARKLVAIVECEAAAA